MGPVDYQLLLEHDSFARRERILCNWKTPVEEVARNAHSVRYASRDGKPRYRHEITQICEHGFLLTTDQADATESQVSQIVRGGDWVHLQFVLDGGTHERAAAASRVDAQAGSCVVARYPEDSLIERGVNFAERSRYACLFLKPAAVAELLQAPAEDLGRGAEWMAAAGRSELTVSVLDLESAMAVAVNDMLGCAYQGSLRRAYMRAKSVELISTVIHALRDAERTARRSHERLSTSDLLKIGSAHSLLSSGAEGPFTLSDLAARVGLNRTKLIYGFKHLYGVTIREYWREVNLDRAYRELREGNASITELALAMGYQDPSSFTRAFTRKFGIIPRKCKA